MKNLSYHRVALFIATVLLALVGCETIDVKKDENALQPDLTDEEIRRLVLLDSSYVYPEEQARINALNLAAQLLDKKDGIKRSISQFITVSSLYTISGKTSIKTDFAISKPQTPSLYIANFNKKDGYVILSADKRATEILATVGSGTIDSLAHPGLKVFLSDAVIHVDEKVAEMESFREDAAFKSIVEKLQKGLKEKRREQINKGARTEYGDEIPCLQLNVPGRVRNTLCPGSDCVYISYTVPIQTVTTENVVRPPLLTTLWDQGPPYNNGQPEGGCSTYGNCGGNSKYLAGCVAIAEAQVVAHFWARNNQDWQSITAKSCHSYFPWEANAVSWLAHAIYLDYGIYVSRECGSVGVGATIGEINLTDPRGISPSYGLVEGEWRDWNVWDVRNSLLNGSPVVASGMRQLCCLNEWWLPSWCWGCGGGHEWVIDGMKDLGIQTTYQFTAYYSGGDCDPSQQEYYQRYTYTTNTTTTSQIHQNWGWGRYQGSEPNDWWAQTDFRYYGHQKKIVAYITPN